MEASSSQPAAAGGSGNARRPINPATQRPVREHAAEDNDSRDKENFDVSDLRRWEDARLSDFDEKLVNLSAVVEGQQEELRAILRNELMIALTAACSAGLIILLMKEVTKMKEASNATED